LCEFGISDASARTALSRLGRRGLLVVRRQGRNTSYRLSDRADEVLTQGVRDILAFASGQQAWDGLWTCVAFSVPERRRSIRPTLRARLRWLGLAPLYDGLWISPHDATPALTALLRELEIHNATIFTGSSLVWPNGLNPVAAWDLAEMREVYEHFISQFTPLLLRARTGMVTANKALLDRTAVMDHWRNMPVMDPGLPDELLPADWPRTEARRIFVETYDLLGELAEVRIRQILAEFSPALALLATHHSSGFLQGQLR
jgi:phenylacetic acid degradation operon negative regulatory protein